MFTLTEEALEHAFRRARLAPRAEGAVLFGIRGATPSAAGSTQLRGSHDLNRTELDYLHARCAIGVWRRGEGFALFPASTIPGRAYVARGVPRGGETVNRLCFGLHRGYRKGTHNSSVPARAHRALRMDRNIPVQRTADDLDYDADDRIEYETAYDNLHCAWVADQFTPGYSSAGCQVIVGGCKPEVGAWAEFMRLVHDTPQIEFDYALFSGGEMERTCSSEAPETLPLALRYGSISDEVEAVQGALTLRGYSTTGVDGEFGWRTLVALFRFQRQAMGLRVPDGVVGAQTLAALGLDDQGRAGPSTPAAPAAPGEDDASDEAKAPGYTFRTETSDAGKFTHHYAKALTGGKGEYYLGYETKYLSTYGLSQSVKRLKPLGAQQYDPADYAGLGYWARLVVPTGSGESGLWFERLNTYDRAALTFGFFQAAAHYPNDNFILLFKAMLARPEGRTWFPDLVLKTTANGPRLFQSTAAGEVDLEVEAAASPTNPEPNLKRFMAYLNPDPAAVEAGELSVTARLLQWTRETRECRDLQVNHAVRALRERMRLFKTELTGRPVDQCLMAADVRYQGRAKPSAIRQALQDPKPYDALCKLGTDHAARIATVDGEIRKLMKDAAIAALRFDPASPTLFK